MRIPKWISRQVCNRCNYSPFATKDPKIQLSHYKTMLTGLIKLGYVIDAIKLTRIITGWGLRDAKNHIDKLVEETQNKIAKK